VFVYGVGGDVSHQIMRIVDLVKFLSRRSFPDFPFGLISGTSVRSVFHHPRYQSDDLTFCEIM